MKWIKGTARSWMAAQGVETPLRVFWHLAECDDVPQGWLGADNTTWTRSYLAARDGDLHVRLRVAYWYVDGSVARTQLVEAAGYAGASAVWGGLMRPAGDGLYRATVESGGRAVARMVRVAVGEDGDWRWELQAWCAATAQYQTTLVCATNCHPACGFWSLASDFADQVAAGDWGTLPTVSSESGRYKWEDWVQVVRSLHYDRSARFLSRCTTGLTIRGGNETDRVRGHYFLVDPAATGTDRVWIHEVNRCARPPHRAVDDNEALRDLFDAAPATLAAGEYDMQRAINTAGYAQARIAYEGGAWVLTLPGSAAGSTRVVWTADGDPDAVGTTWTASAHSDCVTEAWNTWHEDVTTYYGYVRRIVTDSGEAAMVEAAAGISTVDAMPSSWWPTGSGEILPMPDRANLGLDLGRADWDDVHNDYLVLCGDLETAGLVDKPRMAETVGVRVEIDYAGNVWTEYDTWSPYTQIRPLVASYRTVLYTSYACRIETLIEVGWDTSDEDELQDYQDAFAGAFSGGADDGYADYPDFAGVEPAQPNTSATNDGEVRGGYAGYQRGYDSAQRDDEIAGYDAGWSAGIAQAQLDDPDYSPSPPAPPAGTEVYQSYYSSGWIQGYDTWWGYAWYDPPPPDPVGEWGEMFYVPSAYYSETGRQNISGIEIDIGPSSIDIQATVAGICVASYFLGEVQWWVWRIVAIEDIAVAGTGYPASQVTRVTVPPNTDTIRYTPIPGAAGGALTDNGVYYCLPRAAAVLEVEGAPTSGAAPGWYDPAKVSSGYAAPALPPPEWTAD